MGIRKEAVLAAEIIGIKNKHFTTKKRHMISKCRQ